MSKDEALKLALEALETCCAGDYSTGHVIDPSFDEDAVNEAIISLKEALAQDELCLSQEVDWKDQYEKQKRRAEMWIAKYEEVAGPLPYAVPLAQPEQEPVAWVKVKAAHYMPWYDEKPLQAKLKEKNT